MTKIAFKGFDKNLTCRKMQYEIGGVYNTGLVKEPRLCSSDGFHYAHTLLDAYNFYSNNLGNRFCLVKVEGMTKEDASQGIATKLTVLHELTDFEKHYIEAVEQQEFVKERLNIDAWKEIQKRFPMAHVGGSLGLFFHGAYLKRWRSWGGSDLDIVIPYYMNMAFEEKDTKLEASMCKASSNDFNFTLHLESKDIPFTKVDVRVDPLQQYEVIDFEGEKYNVSKLATIIEAKCRYSWRNEKHAKDLKELIQYGEMEKTFHKEKFLESFLTKK